MTAEFNNEKDYLLSLIIPVYNASRFLEKCLESITNQITAQVEVIIIDDGSN